MPTYGYECLDCQAQLEVMQSIKDAPLTVCRTCGGTLRKRVYPVGIAFKGSGFYVNDYAPKSGDAPAAPSPEAKAEAAPTDAKPAEAKPAETKPDAPKADAPKPPAPATA